MALTNSRISYQLQCSETVQNQIGHLKNSVGRSILRDTLSGGTGCLPGSSNSLTKILKLQKTNIFIVGTELRGRNEKTRCNKLTPVKKTHWSKPCPVVAKETLCSTSMTIRSTKKRQQRYWLVWVNSLLHLKEYVRKWEIAFIAHFVETDWKQGLSQVVTNKLAAEALRSTFGGLFSELQGQDAEDKKAVTELLARIDKLGTIRNQLLHAEWYLNYDYEDADNEFTALALKHNASQNRGAYSLKLPVTKATLNGHVRDATEALVLLRRLVFCLNQTGFKVSKVLSKPL